MYAAACAHPDAWIWVSLIVLIGVLEHKLDRENFMWNDACVVKWWERRVISAFVFSVAFSHIVWRVLLFFPLYVYLVIKF